jgi:hypothetical protein
LEALSRSLGVFWAESASGGLYRFCLTIIGSPSGLAVIVARWKAIDYLPRRPPAICRVERRRVFSIIVWIIIIVVVLAVLGFFGRGRF